MPAARGFVAMLRPQDRGAVATFADSVAVLQPLTTDVSLLTGAIDQTRAKGSTALYDALYVALREFGKAARQTGEIRRQVIAVYSDATAALRSRVGTGMRHTVRDQFL